MGRIAGQKITLRTPSGNPTEDARERYGSKKTGSFPVFDQKSALSALRLRGHGDELSKEDVLNKVARYANENNDDRVKEAIRKARGLDRRDPNQMN